MGRKRTGGRGGGSGSGRKSGGARGGDSSGDGGGTAANVASLKEAFQGFLSRFPSATAQDVFALDHQDADRFDAADVMETDEEEASSSLLDSLVRLRDELAAWRDEPRIEEAVVSSLSSSLLSCLSSLGEDSDDLSVQQQLLVALYRSLLRRGESASPDSTPPEVWAAAEVSLELLNAPGASAYCIFHATVYTKILYWLRLWCKSRPSFMASSESAAAAAAAAATTANSAAEDPAAVGRRGKKSGSGSKPSKRLRRNAHQEEMDGQDDSLSQEEDADEMEVGGVAKDEVDDRCSVSPATILRCAKLLRGCIDAVPLLVHDDIRQGLAETLVMVLSVGELEGNSELASEAKMALCSLCTHTSQSKGTSANLLATAVLQSLLPVILMQVGQPGVPVKGKDRLKVHACAVNLATEISDLLSHSGQLAEKCQSDDDSPKKGVRAPPGADVGGGDDDDDNNDDDDDFDKKEGDYASDGDDGNDNFVDRGAYSQQSPPHPVLILLHHICVRAPDRAAIRAKTAQIVGQITTSLDVRNTMRFISFITKLSQSSKLVNRSFAVEVASKLLHQASIWETVGSSGGADILFEIVLSRCADKAPTIRSRAAAAISSILEPLATETDNGADGEVPAGLRAAVLGGREGYDEPEEEGGKILAVLRSRIEDEKAAVRRHAVSALENLLLVVHKARQEKCSSGLPEHEREENVSTFSASDLELFERRCNDTSVATRKAAMTSLSNLLLVVPNEAHVQKVWVRTMLPLAQDPEPSCQAKLHAMVHSVICEEILRWHRAAVDGSLPLRTESETSGGLLLGNKNFAVWGLLHFVQTETDVALLKQAIGALLLGKSGGATGASGQPLNPRPIIEALRDAISLSMARRKSEEAELKGHLQALATVVTDVELNVIHNGAWKVMEAVLDVKAPPGSDALKSLRFVDPLFLVECWDSLSGRIKDASSRQAEREDARRILCILSLVSSRIPREVALPLIKQLKSALHAMTLDVALIGGILVALREITYANAASPEKAASDCKVWLGTILKECEKTLSSYIHCSHQSSRGERTVTEPLVKRALYLIGESVMVSLAPGGEGVRFNLDMPAEIIKLVQLLLPPSLPEGEVLPSAMRALAFVALGKLCLRDQSLAKESINVLMQEMASSEFPAIRSNSLIVLGDLCVRYTALVDRHVGAMASAMQDPSPLVRRHAILLLGQLILQDYVKWRGLLLFRFLAALADSDPSIADLAKFTLTGSLLQKFPHLFVQHFVESLIVLNGFSEHPMYIAARAVGSESGAGVSMDGIHLTEEERKAIYAAMLERMSDEERIQVTAKIAHDIMEAASEGRLSVVDKVGSAASRDTLNKVERVLRDAFSVLSSPGLRVGASSADGEAGGDDLEDEEMALEGTQTRIKTAKSKILKTLSRKHLMEHLVPVLIGLKHVLEKGRSPLLRELMGYFRELLRLYKSEVREVLAAEPSLACEIEYDLKQWEKEDKEKKRRASLDAFARRQSLSSSPGKVAVPSSREQATPPGTKLALERASAVRRASFGGRTGGLGGATPMTVAKAAAKTPTAAILTSTKGSSVPKRTPSQAVRAVLGGEGSAALAAPDARELMIQSPSSSPATLRRRWSISLKQSALDEVSIGAVEGEDKANT